MRRLLAIAAIALFIAAAGIGAGGWWLAHWWRQPGPSTLAKTVLLHKGGARAIGAQLAAAGVVDRPLSFALASRLFDRGTFKAGEYAIPAAATPADLADLLISGRVVIHRLVLPEGRTTAEALALVAGAPALAGAVSRAPGEGQLMPETYFYTYGEQRQTLIDRMERALANEMALLWPKRDPGLPLQSPDQAIILASIVERETARPAERPLIAGVFYNRLRLGMPLQSDPTVAYAVDHGRTPLDRPLTKADLGVDSPFNTYLRRGLPPGPIANPGRASIQAVLHPERTDALYFVADGTGGHNFAATLSQHQRNVRNWRGLATARGR